LKVREVKESKQEVIGQKQNLLSCAHGGFSIL